MKVKFGIAILMVCCGVWVSTMAVAQPSDMRHVTVTGEGRVAVVPDTLVVRASVSHTADTIAKARQVTDAQVRKATHVALSLGVDKRDVTATQTRAYPQYETQDDKRHLVGYRVQRAVTVTLHDLHDYDALLSGLVKAGVNHIDGMSRRYSHPARLRKQAYARAIADAKSKAARLAKGFDAQLGAVRSIEEVSSPSARPLQAPRTVMMAQKSASVQPGTINVTARIHVVFALSD